MEISKVIRSHGFDLATVAKGMGIQRGSLANQISKKNPQVSYLRKIAEIIGADMTEFFADEVSSPSEAKEASHGLVCPHCGKPIDVSLTKHE